MKTIGKIIVCVIVVLACLAAFLALIATSSAIFVAHPSKTGVKGTSFKKLSKISEKYCIEYGRKDAPVQITEFFSLQCSHCIQLFRNDFEKIKKEWIDTGKIHFKFHPVPMDLTTFRAMICIGQLNEREKKLFLEVILEEADPQDQELMAKFMMTAMNVFEKPLDLTDQEFLHNHPIFEEILPFLKQEQVLAVPTVEINDQLFVKEIPSHQFIKTFIQD